MTPVRLWRQARPVNRNLFGAALLLCALATVLAAIGIIPTLRADYLTAMQEHALTIPLGLVGYYVVVYALACRPSFKALVSGIVGGLTISVLISRLWPYVGRPEVDILYLLTLPGAGLGIVALISLLFGAARAKDGYDVHGDMLVVCAGVMVAAPGLNSLLQLTTTLHPATYDPAAFRADGMLGFQPSVLFGLMTWQSDALRGLLIGVYEILPFAFAALYARQITLDYRGPVNLLVFQLAGVVAVLFFLYHLAPVAGPLFLFQANYPQDAVLPLLVPDLTIVRPATRNGVPSMHFGWALALWLNAHLMAAPRFRLVFAAFAALTFVATLGLGQHYLVDLAASFPVILFLQAVCTRGLPVLHPQRCKWMGVGLGLTLTWIMIVRNAGRPLDRVPGGMWLAMITSTLVCLYFYRDYIRFVGSPTYYADTANRAAADHRAPSRGLTAVALLCFCSGIAGLTYEATVAKQLALTFGNTALATAAVLVGCMGGMAVGVWLGGLIGDRSRRLLMLYACAQLALGLYCVASPWLLGVALHGHVALAIGSSLTASPLLTLPFVLGGAVLAVPTILMGATLPILVAHFHRRGLSVGVSIGRLCAANTLGAACGALAAGFWIIPSLGVYETTLAAALLNVLVALAAIGLFKRAPYEVPAAAATRPIAAVQDSFSTTVWPAYLLLGVAGMVTLAIEIDYIHLLAVVAGTSTYAFSLMLFTFMLGLGLGLEAARRALSALRLDLALSLAWLELLLAAVLSGGLYLWNVIPGYLGDFAAYAPGYAFGAHEFVRGVACGLAMFPPALLIGAIYPIAMEWVGRANRAHAVRAIGNAAAINAVGSVGGALLGGFVLLPWIGAFKSVQLLAATCGLLALLMLTRSRSQRWSFARLGPVIGAAGLLAVQPTQFNYSDVTSGSNVYFRPPGWGRAIDHVESLGGGLTTIMLSEAKDGRSVQFLLFNGIFRGASLAADDALAPTGFVFAPMLHTPQRDRALVIGYGTGIRSRTMHDAGFKAVDVVELSADIIDTADRHFATDNDRSGSLAGVNAYVTGGRYFLSLPGSMYDLVTVDACPIWSAGSGSLYNREFYHLAKNRMTTDGVLQQSVQLHHVTQEDLMYILGTVRAEFRYVWVYAIGAHGTLIASNSNTRQPTLANASLLDARQSLHPLLERQPGGSAAAMLQSLILAPDNVDRLLGAFSAQPEHWVSTDDNMFLEYNSPKGIASPDQDAAPLNVAFLRRYGAAQPPTATASVN